MSNKDLNYSNCFIQHGCLESLVLFSSLYLAEQDGLEIRILKLTDFINKLQIRLFCWDCRVWWGRTEMRSTCHGSRYSDGCFVATQPSRSTRAITHWQRPECKIQTWFDWTEEILASRKNCSNVLILYCIISTGGVFLFPNCRPACGMRGGRCANISNWYKPSHIIPHNWSLTRAEASLPLSTINSNIWGEIMTKCEIHSYPPLCP